jgi:hypothetical protein
VIRFILIPILIVFARITSFTRTAFRYVLVSTSPTNFARTACRYVLISTSPTIFAIRLALFVLVQANLANVPAVPGAAVKPSAIAVQVQRNTKSPDGTLPTVAIAMAVRTVVTWFYYGVINRIRHNAVKNFNRVGTINEVQKNTGGGCRARLHYFELANWPVFCPLYPRLDPVPRPVS